MMLQDVIKQTQRTMSFIIEDINNLIEQLNKLLIKHDIQSQKIEKLIKMIAQFQGALKSVDDKSQLLTKESLKIKCPKYLDIERLKEILNEQPQQDIYTFIINNYEEKEIKEENKTVKKWILKENINNETLDEMVKIFKNIGYFDIKNIATSKISNSLKKAFK